MLLTGTGVGGVSVACDIAIAGVGGAGVIMGMA